MRPERALFAYMRKGYMGIQMEQNTAEIYVSCIKTGRNSRIVTVYARRYLILPIRKNDTLL